MREVGLRPRSGDLVHVQHRAGVLAADEDALVVAVPVPERGSRYLRNLVVLQVEIARHIRVGRVNTLQLTS